MTARSPTRDPECGHALVLLMIVLTALGTLSGLTVVSMQGGLSTASNDRFHSISTYAAESGGAIAMEWLRANVDASTNWTAQLQSSTWTTIMGNDAQPGTSGNPFSIDQQAWYSVTILNNKSDTGYAATVDNDRRVIIHVTGYGPNGAVSVLEWEVAAGSAGCTLLGWRTVL